MLGDEIPAPPSPGEYYPDGIILYGVKLNDGFSAMVPFGDNLALKMKVVNRDHPEDGLADYSFAAIYGYAFEGYCYRLDKPKIYTINAPHDPASGCGFDEQYKMWTVRSRGQIMELSLDYDFAETLILEANLPGNKGPNTYGNGYKIAHRGGKLTTR